MTTSLRVVRPVPRVVLASLLLGLLGSLPALALWEAADGEVFVSLDASVSADSNIGSNALEQSDTIYAVTPGVSWERSRGRGSVSFGAQVEIERASEAETYDSENYSADFSLSMPATGSGRLRGTFDASYFDGSRVNSFQNTRISEQSYDLNLSGAYHVSARINARAGATYGKTEPETLAEYESNSLSAGLGYNLSPDVSLFLDARFRDSSSERLDGLGSSSDTSGNAFLVGLDGQLTARLSGQIGIGYDQSETSFGGVEREYSGFTYDASLTWTPRERTSLTLDASNGVQSTSSGGTEYSRVNLSVAQEIGLNMSASVGVGFRSSDFASSARGDDDVMDATARFRYAMTRNISWSLAYRYTDADSTSVIVNYSRSVWTFSGTARF